MKVEHTWHEGIRACKVLRQSKAAKVQQLHAAQQQQRNESSNKARIINSILVVMVTPTPIIPPTNRSVSTPLKRTMDHRDIRRIAEPYRMSVHSSLTSAIRTTRSSPASSSVSISAQSLVKSLTIIDYTNLLFVIICRYH